MGNKSIILKFFFFIFLCSCFMSCKNEKRIEHSEKRERDSLVDIVPSAKIFYEHQFELNEIVDELYKVPLFSKKFQLVFFVPDNFDNSLQKKMKSLGIVKILYYEVYCDSLAKTGKKSFEFDFITNWGDKVPTIHITKQPCFNEGNKLGSYDKNVIGNEIWGLGADNWVVWYEHHSTYTNTFPPTYSR